MASFTTWTRLEPNPRQAAMEETLKARIYDPLWMLARQWQLGEFQGEDNGSPVTVSLQGESSQLTRFAPGPLANAPVQAERFDPTNIPLEVLVERERARPRPNAFGKLQFAAEAGQHFLRMLGRESFGSLYHAAIVAKFPLSKPNAEQAAVAGPRDLKFLTIVSGRVPDGAAIANALRHSGALNNIVRAEHQAAVQQVSGAFMRWYDGLFNEPTSGAKEDPAWLPSRMEYAFAVAASTPGPSFTTAGGTGGETVLVAREYSSGHLDWLDFDLRPGATLGAAADRTAGGNPLPTDQAVIPSPVTFRGMPAPRWWEFEDAAVDFGAVEPDPQDLARMLMLEFAISYGNDWFVVPLDLAVGSISRITSVIVTDTFGVRTMIPSIAGSTHPAASTWRMFAQSIDRAAGPSLTSAARPPDIFFLAPTLMRTLEGKPLEEILFVRDEMANLAWGVEGTVEGPSGRAVDRRQVYAERQPNALPPSSARKDALLWRLATDVPDYWIPLIPVLIDKTSGAIAFRRGATLRPDGSRNTQSAQSRILMPDAQNKLDMFEEEIPREGARVTRGFQYARWLNGAPLLWIGRRKQPGRGEGSSGLKFDTARKPEATNSQ
jgi:hypothetical protein